MGVVVRPIKIRILSFGAATAEEQAGLETALEVKEADEGGDRVKDNAWRKTPVARQSDPLIIISCLVTGMEIRRNLHCC
jgi:hypothetical protein